MIIKIISIDKTVIEDNVDIITLRGSDGTYGIMKNHENLISDIVEGVVVLKNSIEEKRYYVDRGILKSENQEVTIITEFCKNIDNLEKNIIEQKVSLLKKGLEDEEKKNIQKDFIRNEL